MLLIYGTTISENYLIRYGISLLSQPQLWHVAIDYFSYCGPFARNLLQEARNIAHFNVWVLILM